MNSFLNPYTVDKSRPVDPVTLHILSVVNRLAAELELRYIVVGANSPRSASLSCLRNFGHPRDGGCRFRRGNGFMGEVSRATGGAVYERPL